MKQANILKANILLGSETATAEDFKALLVAEGTLHASPLCLDAKDCVKVVTPHAAIVLQSCGIKRLNLQSNQHLVQLPAKELCSISSLEFLACKGCASLKTIPQSMAERGGKAAMTALHESLLTDVAGAMEDGRHETALAMLAALPIPTRHRLKVKVEKAEANILLASNLGSEEAFHRLLRDGTLDASPVIEKDHSMARSLCVRTISLHAAAALLSSGITCLDVSFNSHLVMLPAKELCNISTLVRLECRGCPRLLSPPREVAESGGDSAMTLLRECMNNGTLSGR